MVFWDHELISQNIVNAARAHDAGVAEVSNLDGGGSQCHDCRSAPCRESRQINDDINLKLTDEVRHIPVALVVNVDETVKRPFQPCPHFALIVRPERDGNDFESGAIMVLKQ